MCLLLTATTDSGSRRWRKNKKTDNCDKYMEERRGNSQARKRGRKRPDERDIIEIG
jgi:hypothetical protein